MHLRKRLVRGLVFAVLAALAAASWLYQQLTHPSAVRQQVVAKLESHFRGTEVRLDWAALRLLGGISISELRLVRSHDPERGDLLYVPSGIIYHDKEQLLDGKLAIRKVELYRPRLHIIRQRDGSWNTTGILGPVDPNEPIPAIILQKATILVEDRCALPDAAPVEIRDVNLAILNDPLPTLRIELHGKSELLGELHAQASWHRVSEALTLSLAAPAVPIGPSLLQRLAAYCSQLGEQALQLEALTALRVELKHTPGSEPAWTHDAQLTVRQGKLRHPRIPLPLDHVEASVRCSNGVIRLETVTAQAGSARFELEGTVTDPCPTADNPCVDPDLDLKLKVAGLPLDAELFAQLPKSMQTVQEDYGPTGTVHLDLDAARRNGQWRRKTVVAVEDVTASYVNFPYRLDQLHGRIDELLDEARGVHVRHFDLVGAAANGRPVHIRGSVDGSGVRPDVSVDIWGDNIPLDERLLAALPEKFKPLARSFHASGQGDMVVRLRRPHAQPEFANRITVRFHDCRVRYEAFPYPLDNVEGVLDILPDQWEFRDFHGSHKGGEFFTWGRSHPLPGEGKRISVGIRGKDLKIDEELERALPPKLQAAWRSLTPGGRMSVEAHVNQLPDRPEDISVAVTTQGCTLRPQFFPYALAEVAGSVRYAAGKVVLEKLSAVHDATRLAIDKGEIFLKPAGGFWAQFALRGEPVVVDPDLLAALPPVLKKAAALFQPRTSLGMTTELVIDMPGEPNLPPDIYWDGGLSVQNATLETGVTLNQVSGQAYCQGRHDGRQLQGIKGNVLLDQLVLFKQPFRDLHAHVIVEPDSPEVLRLPDLKARLFGGDVGGEMRVEFGPTIHYEVNATALQVRLEDFGRHNVGQGDQWKGLASARLYLAGHGKDLHGLEGNGSIDVPHGQLYNLPLLLDLLKVLGLRPPDRTAFEEAHANFSIRGPRVIVSRLDLDGNAVSLSGQGELNIDGSDVKLDFYAVWGRIKQILPPLFREIPPAVGQQLLKIKMRGKVGDVQVTKEPVPALIEPLERLLKRIMGRGGSPAAQPPPLPGADKVSDDQLRR